MHVQSEKQIKATDKMENTILTNTLNLQDVLASTRWLVRSACVERANLTPIGTAIHLFLDQTNSALVTAFTIKKGSAWVRVHIVHWKDKNFCSVKSPKTSDRTNPITDEMVPMVDIPTVEVDARVYQ